MKQILHHTIFALSALTLAGTFTAAAQQLSKEITIEREIEPEVRAASRLELFPRTLTFTNDKGSLQFADYTEASAINPGISQLGAARTIPAIGLTPYRGYVDAGYFPTADVGVSAGYAIHNSDRTQLNVWGQFTNASYKARPFSTLDKVTYSRLSATVGAAFAAKIGDFGRLSISTDVTFSRFNNLSRLLLEADPDVSDNAGLKKWQGLTDWSIRAGWDGHNSGGLLYHANLRFGLTDFTSTGATGIAMTGDGEWQAMTFKPVHETRYGASFGASQSIGESQRAGVEINADFSNINRYRTVADLMAIAPEGDVELSAGALQHMADAKGRTFGVVSLTPYYRYAPQGSPVSLKVGARVDFSIHSAKAVHVAPDVTFGVNPASGFGAWIKLDGGEHLNSIARLSDFTCYISPLLGYGISNIPVKGEVGLRFGPFKGASITLDAAYAAANDWLMPVWEAGTEQIVFEASRLRSWKAGAHIVWDFRSLLSLEAGFETLLTNDRDHAWYSWLDRSRSRLTASLSIRPISPLTIDLGYTMALHRRMTATVSDAAGVPESCEINLKNRHRLNVGASYRFSQPFTVFARVENLLNRTEYDAAAVASQGITGAIGVGFKF